MVGDPEVDVLTARNAGMLAASVNYGLADTRTRFDPADLYSTASSISSLKQL